MTTIFCMISLMRYINELDMVMILTSQVALFETLLAKIQNLQKEGKNLEEVNMMLLLGKGCLTPR